MVEKVVVFALKSGMWLLLNLELHITWLYPGHLITLTTEIDLVTALHSSVNVHMQNFSFYHGLLAQATLAPVLVTDYFALPLAVWADGLESLDHGSHLSHHSLHTCAIAARACLDRAFFPSTSITSWADD